MGGHPKTTTSSIEAGSPLQYDGYPHVRITGKSGTGAAGGWRGIGPIHLSELATIRTSGYVNER